jgi:hypothetical protein
VSLVGQFTDLLSLHGSVAHFHRVDSEIPCPCQTPEGFRDPDWHDANPAAPVCDEEGMLPDPAHTVDLDVQAMVQPIQSTRATRLQTEYFAQMFGEIEADDHLGIFPVNWGGQRLDFWNWSATASSYVTYNTRRFTVVNSNLIPDPSDGNPEHHWEVGLRLIHD